MHGRANPPAKSLLAGRHFLDPGDQPSPLRSSLELPLKLTKECAKTRGVKGIQFYQSSVPSVVLLATDGICVAAKVSAAGEGAALAIYLDGAEAAHLGSPLVPDLYFMAATL